MNFGISMENRVYDLTNRDDLKAIGRKALYGIIVYVVGSLVFNYAGDSRDKEETQVSPRTETCYRLEEGMLKELDDC